MARLTRGEVIDPHEINIVHVINRTVRRCFLFGNDQLSGKNFDHRKDWIEQLLQDFSACFGIDLLCYSILSNHYHLILRTRPDVVATWDDTEVARRWLRICPLRKIDGRPAEPTDAELNTIRRCPVRLAEIRERLSSVSWWMRLLNQRVAQRANREEQESGRFWQDRFHAIRLIDEEALVACAAYVELNPIRAAMAQTLETSEHTSVKRRIETEVANGDASPSEEESRSRNRRTCKTRRSGKTRRDDFLAPLELSGDSVSAAATSSRTGLRCSDKGFLSMTTREYLQLLDWTARQSVEGKRGSTPESMPPILRRLGLEATSWSELGAQNMLCPQAHSRARSKRCSGQNMLCPQAHLRSKHALSPSSVG
jgi:REP element-mobilizing transposase RayT